MAGTAGAKWSLVLLCLPQRLELSFPSPCRDCSPMRWKFDASHSIKSASKTSRHRDATQSRDESKADLVGAARTRILVEFANEAGKDWTNQRENAEQPEAIEEAEHRGLSLHFGVKLRGGASCGVGLRITVV